MSRKRYPLSEQRGGWGGVGRGAPQVVCVRFPVDLLEKIGPCFHHPFCELIIAELVCDCIQGFVGHTGTQVALSSRERSELLIGSHHSVIGILLLDLSFVVDDALSEMAGSMEVDIGI